MKTRRRLIIVSCVAITAVAVATVAMLYLLHIMHQYNDLGLSEFDMMIAGRTEMDLLRANTQAAGDAFLNLHKNDLTDLPDGTGELTVDYAKSSKIRSLGYGSSFYYYCWDIYLPYSPRAPSGKIGTVLVHLTDSVGHQHDPRKFHVLDVRLLDQDGKVTRMIKGY